MERERKRERDARAGLLGSASGSVEEGSEGMDQQADLREQTCICQLPVPEPTASKREWRVDYRGWAKKRAEDQFDRGRRDGATVPATEIPRVPEDYL
jgi:hypothetical protein